METLERLGPPHVKAAVVGYRDALRAHQDAINQLNVYPVPDGDTGTNMALTLESVVAELNLVPSGRAAEEIHPAGQTHMEEVCRALSHGSLMGARGNSGVILSQILRGVAEGCRHAPEIDATTLADGLRRASDGAYGAVMRP